MENLDVREGTETSVEDNNDQIVEDAQGDTVPKAALGKVLSQRKQFKEQAEALETKVKELQALIDNKTDTPKPQSSGTEEVTKESFERLRLETKGYAGDEIDFIMRNAQGRSIDETLSDGFVSEAIESMRSKVKSDQATPPPSAGPSRQSVPAPDKSFADMSEEERRANFSAVVDKHKK